MEALRKLGSIVKALAIAIGCVAILIVIAFLGVIIPVALSIIGLALFMKMVYHHIEQERKKKQE